MALETNTHTHAQEYCIIAHLVLRLTRCSPCLRLEGLGKIAADFSEVLGVRSTHSHWVRCIQQGADDITYCVSDELRRNAGQPQLRIVPNLQVSYILKVNSYAILSVCVQLIQYLFSNSSSSSDFDSSLDKMRRTLSPVMKRRISDIAYSVCSSSRKRAGKVRSNVWHAGRSFLKWQFIGREVHQLQF